MDAQANQNDPMNDASLSSKELIEQLALIAVREIKNKKGATKQEIRKFLHLEYGKAAIDHRMRSSVFRKVLRKAVAKGLLRRNKGRYMIGPVNVPYIPGRGAYGPSGWANLIATGTEVHGVAEPSDEENDEDPNNN